MRISILTFGAVASIIAINSVFADTTSTVTSRGYVDAAVATKQPKIPAAGTNASTPGETVVTYTSTGDGTIGERGIVDMESGYIAGGLVTAEALEEYVNCMQNHQTGFECVEENSNGDCMLVTLFEEDRDCDNPFDGKICSTNSDCNQNENERCFNGRCVAVEPTIG